MSRAQFMKMHLLLMMTMSVMYFSEMTSAQPVCDPITQYEHNGECCRMCGPGTRMPSLSTCLDPQCTDCERNEYQDKYTKETKCDRQPYCDPNKNFDAGVQKIKTKEFTCVCKVGFHCSSKECITCVSHRLCPPGHGAQSRGNHTHNTVCQKCTEGTFSKDKSWNDVCEKWTECMDGYHVKQSGTDVSDNICEESLRLHIIGIVVFCVFLFLFLFVVLCATRCYLCKGKPGDIKGKVKVGVKSCLCFSHDEKEPLRETKVLITNPTDPIEEESMVPERQSSQEEAGLRTPEENEDELSQELSDDFVLTENGNFVTQENGKSVVLSRQESQTQTFTD